MYKLITILFLFFNYNLIFSQPQILDPAKIWAAEGLHEGEYPLTMDMESEEDIILNMYYNPKKEWDDERTVKIQSVLPLGKEGAYRIAALLFFKLAENPELKEEYEKKIKSFLKYLINQNEVLYDNRKKEYKTIGGFTIAFDEAKKYYEEALKNKLSEFELKFSDNKEKESYKKMICQYFFDPNETNFNIITYYMKKLYKTDLINFSSRIVYLNEISNKFTKRLIGSLIP